MKKLFAALLIGILAHAAPASARDLNVVASFTVLADMVRQVGGDHVHVRSLIGPNGDPHVYEPTPQDGNALAKADLVFVSGLGLEGWMDRLIKASGYKGAVVVASEGVATLSVREEGKNITDPHAWNSAANGVIYARNIAFALAKADPQRATDYKIRGDRYMQQLQALDSWAHKMVNAIPANKRKVISSHDAFGYLGAGYGIEFHAPVGFSTESEASAADVARLIDQIRRERIRAVFLENSNDPRMIRQIASETGAVLGGTLYAEALSAPGGPAPDYATMFRHNIELLVKGMRGN